jgi:hypothetical protein
MREQEVASTIGWMMVASGALAVMLSGLLLALLGLLIAGHIWAAVVLCLTLARYGYYLYVRFKK